MDSLNVWSSVIKFPDQVDQVLKEFSTFSVPDNFHQVQNITLAGMGGSALSGRVLLALERESLKVPFQISTEFHLPSYVDKNSLVIISTYSGNTEESLTCLDEVIARNAQVFAITAGGKLAQLINDKNIYGYVFDTKNNPSNQPRMSLGYSTTILALFLSKCGFFQLPSNLTQLIPYLTAKNSNPESWQSLARHLSGKIPVFIVSEHLKGSVHSLKNQINENAKNFACYFDLPEINHHLLEGLSYPKSNPDNLFFIFIKSAHYHPEVKKRYALSEEVVKKQNIPYLEISLAGPNRFFETFELLQAAGYLGFYLSQQNGVDPGPIPWVDWYKHEIRQVV